MTSPALGWIVPHLTVTPVLVPMLAAAVMLLVGEARRRLALVIGAAAMLAGLGASVTLLVRVGACGPIVYVPGGWPTAFGIAVVADHLAALMLVVAWTLGLCALTFASARWYRAGVHFQPLLQVQLMGLSGAFLAGDVFNLFVFFEITLAASYGLVLHGAGRTRIRAGLHYLAVNLVASSLFLVGATMLYGVTGTLNLAALSERAVHLAGADRALVHAGAAILGVAFLAKAAAWPLNLWLVPAYAAATAPAAAIFAVLTKLGVYSIARVGTLLLAGDPSAGPGADALLAFGTVTAALASLGMLGMQRLAFQAGLSVIVSAGTLLAALGLRRAEVTAGALFYLVSSTLTASALFLVVDLVERWRNAGVTVDEAPYLDAALQERDVNLDDEQEPLVGLPFPASTAFLGLAFLACALLVAGLPPFSSFVGKAAMLSAAIGPRVSGISARSWLFVAVLLGSGLLSLVALTRTGIRTFFAPTGREGPRIRVAEGVPLVALLLACAALTVVAGPVSRYALDAARALHAPAAYVNAVLGPAEAQVYPRPAP